MLEAALYVQVKANDVLEHLDRWLSRCYFDRFKHLDYEHWTILLGSRLRSFLCSMHQDDQ